MGLKRPLQQPTKVFGKACASIELDVESVRGYGAAWLTTQPEIPAYFAHKIDAYHQYLVNSQFLGLCFLYFIQSTVDYGLVWLCTGQPLTTAAGLDRSTRSSRIKSRDHPMSPTPVTRAC
ncbi:hypothetical protein RRG08_019301 [Elysia crispata]|uniref:Uncharacterized protein n=1 Tax=Elysia crispata TaxID=231223 RepID=A0AAE1D137_9GAST|nr:hypothetical protein RRG08_019301 [Elysia crispata]